jgi:hypothetical protein
LVTANHHVVSTAGMGLVEWFFVTVYYSTNNLNLVFFLSTNHHFKKKKKNSKKISLVAILFTMSGNISNFKKVHN